MATLCSTTITGLSTVCASSCLQAPSVCATCFFGCGAGITGISAGGGFSNMCVVTSSTHWCVPAGISKVKVYATGGGGGGISTWCGTYQNYAGSAGGTAVGIHPATAGCCAYISIGSGGFGQYLNCTPAHHRPECHRHDCNCYPNPYWHYHVPHCHTPAAHNPGSTIWCTAQPGSTTTFSLCGSCVAAGGGLVGQQCGHNPNPFTNTPPQGGKGTCSNIGMCLMGGPGTWVPNARAYGNICDSPGAVGGGKSFWSGGAIVQYWTYCTSAHHRPECHRHDCNCYPNPYWHYHVPHCHTPAAHNPAVTYQCVNYENPSGWGAGGFAVSYNMTAQCGNTFQNQAICAGNGVVVIEY